MQSEGSPFGVPHHTDTSVIFYDRAALDTAGVTVPTTLETAWTWDQLDAVGQALRSSLPAEKFPFADNWQGNGVTRWLTWLFEADGAFLSKDLSEPAIDSDAGRAAVELTQSFFPKRYVPPNASVKSTTYAADLWYSGTTAMVWGGAFMVPAADSTVKGEWGVTYAPRRVRAASDFGGNALVATAKTTKAELAAAFLDFVTGKEQQRSFCASASLLPTRADLVEEGITLDVRPDLSEVFTGQASTVAPQDSAQVASPDMSAIIPVLQDALEQAFVGSASAADTVRSASEGIAAAISR